MSQRHCSEDQPRNRRWFISLGKTSPQLLGLFRLQVVRNFYVCLLLIHMSSGNLTILLGSNPTISMTFQKPYTHCSHGMTPTAFRRPTASRIIIYPSTTQKLGYIPLAPYGEPGHKGFQRQFSMWLSFSSKLVQAFKALRSSLCSAMVWDVFTEAEVGASTATRRRSEQPWNLQWNHTM